MSKNHQRRAAQGGVNASTREVLSAARGGHHGYILVAIADPTLRSEAVHAAAATSLEVVQAEDPRDIMRLSSSATAILADALTAPTLAGADRSALSRAGGHTPVVFFMAADPGPINYEAALKCRARQAFILPAESTMLLGALGAVVEQSTQRGARSSPARGGCIAVAGTAGGVGTSTFAVALARTVGEALLVDADPRSGGLDLLLGIESVPGARWPELNFGDGNIDANDLKRALPATSDGIAVLSQARSTVADSFQLKPAVVDGIIKAMHSDPGFIIVDCPVDAIPQDCHHTVLITAAEVRSAAVAQQAVLRLSSSRIPYSLVLRHRQWSGLDREDVEKLVHCPVSAEVPTIKGLMRHVETSGLPTRLPGALTKAAEAVLAEAEGGRAQ
ncbi:septum site-determining protein Ssd [Corynebacterium flavescens]|uniref:septum site-determining protein Ssd n=1 Tax=Corynebacterium flavescens TaxID=28028 RepID=UPI0009FFAD94|nr:septum site-determining protein Ssd [Corynebacterium flavescens]KAA8724660.1 septum formation initiator [Corynebacterium flavescens]